ncbi:MAG: ribonuclease III, partial [Cyanobacteria bacterium P01_F01_bin.4]
MAPHLDPLRRQALESLLRRLGLSDMSSVQWALLHQSLVDISTSPDHNNQQLEFLGDATLRLAAAE